MRAIPHVVGKAIRSSRRARRACRLLVEDDHGASGGTPIQPDGVGGGRWGGPSWSSRERACPDGRPPGGEGSAGPRSGRSSDVRAGGSARFRLRLRSSARARTARSHVVQSGRTAVRRPRGRSFPVRRRRQPVAPRDPGDSKASAGKSARSYADDELEEMLGAIEVLEPVLTELPERDVARQLVSDRLARGSTTRWVSQGADHPRGSQAWARDPGVNALVRGVTGGPLFGGEHEALDRDVGVDVVGAEEGDQVAPGACLRFRRWGSSCASWPGQPRRR